MTKAETTSDESALAEKDFLDSFVPLWLQRGIGLLGWGASLYFRDTRPLAFAFGLIGTLIIIHGFWKLNSSVKWKIFLVITGIAIVATAGWLCFPSSEPSLPTIQSTHSTPEAKVPKRAVASYALKLQRPKLFLASGNIVINQSGSATVNIQLVNRGNADGRITGERSIVGVVNKALSAHAPKDQVFYDYLPSDLVAEDVIQEFSPGVLPGQIFASISKDRLIHLDTPNEPLSTIFEIDYCEVSRRAPRCWTLHLNIRVKKKEGNILLMPDKAYTLPTNGHRRSQEMFETIISR